jgi:hypothetical protein
MATLSELLHVAKEVAITATLVIGPVIGFFALLAVVFFGAFVVFGPI